MTQRKQRTLITGASTGLGYEFSKLAAADGRDLILVARNTKRLDEVAAEVRARHGVEAEVIGCDLSLAQASQRLYEEARGRELSVDVLINNAGFGQLGYFRHTDPGLVNAMIQTNVTALTLLTRLFLADMAARAQGRILNVASLAAYTPGPLMAVYHATKAYVLAFSEAIAEELRGSGVSVTALVPGITRTEFQERAGIEQSKLGGAGMSAAEVAKAGYRAMLAGKTVCVPGAGNSLLAFLAHHTPHLVATQVAHRMQRRLLRDRP